MRIATFGDIHGNLFALQAVLADLRTQKPDGLLVTGDLVYKFPWGAEVVDLLRSLPCQIILGNAELYLILWGSPLWPGKWDLPGGRDLVAWERERLGGDRLAWLASSPETRPFRAGGWRIWWRCMGRQGILLYRFWPVPARIARPGCRAMPVCASCWRGLTPTWWSAGTPTHPCCARWIAPDRQPWRAGLRPRRQHRRRPGGLCTAGLVGGRGLAGHVPHGVLQSRAAAPRAAGVARRLSRRRACCQPHAPVPYCACR